MYVVEWNPPEKERERERGVHRANKTVGVCKIFAHNIEVLSLNKCNIIFIRSMK